MDAYADFIDEVSAGGFRAPDGGGWTAEQIAAQVARNHEELIAVTVLRDLTGQLGARGNTLVPARVVEGGEILVDQPLPWGKLLELDEEVSVPRRLAQLRALRRHIG